VNIICFKRSSKSK